jgi:hypothetical protein
MTAMTVLETFCVFVAAVESAEPLEPLLTFAVGDGEATVEDTLLCTAGGAEDEVGSDPDSESVGGSVGSLSDDVAVPEVEVSECDSVAELSDVEVGSASDPVVEVDSVFDVSVADSESEVEVGSADAELESVGSLVSVGLAVPVLDSVGSGLPASLLSAIVILREWNVIWLVLLNLVSGIFVTVMM